MTSCLDTIFPHNHHHHNNKDIISHLPTELFSHIFSYISSDLVTLHTCLLINRRFWIETLPIIYSDPFHPRFLVPKDPDNVGPFAYLKGRPNGEPLEYEAWRDHEKVPEGNYSPKKFLTWRYRFLVYLLFVNAHENYLAAATIAIETDEKKKKKKKKEFCQDTEKKKDQEEEEQAEEEQDDDIVMGTMRFCRQASNNNSNNNNHDDFCGPHPRYEPPLMIGNPFPDAKLRVSDSQGYHSDYFKGPDNTTTTTTTTTTLGDSNSLTTSSTLSPPSTTLPVLQKGSKVLMANYLSYMKTFRVRDFLPARDFHKNSFWDSGLVGFALVYAISIPIYCQVAPQLQILELPLEVDMLRRFISMTPSRYSTRDAVDQLKISDPKGRNENGNEKRQPTTTRRRKRGGLGPGGLVKDLRNVVQVTFFGHLTSIGGQPSNSKNEMMDEVVWFLKLHDSFFPGKLRHVVKKGTIQVQEVWTKQPILQVFCLHPPPLIDPSLSESNHDGTTIPTITNPLASEWIHATILPNDCGAIVTKEKKRRIKFVSNPYPCLKSCNTGFGISDCCKVVWVYYRFTTTRKGVTLMDKSNRNDAVPTTTITTMYHAVGKDGGGSGGSGGDEILSNRYSAFEEWLTTDHYE